MGKYKKQMRKEATCFERRIYHDPSSFKEPQKIKMLLEELVQDEVIFMVEHYVVTRIRTDKPRSLTMVQDHLKNRETKY
ncbi:hypothetical protein AAHB56_15750 [Bacillus thuringiensis]|nr:hypothetical protein [Bacillus sp. OR9]